MYHVRERKYALAGTLELSCEYNVLGPDFFLKKCIVYIIMMTTGKYGTKYA